MKKVAVMIMMLSLLALSGCGLGKPVKIGFSATLSGEDVKLGEALRNGVMLRIDEINESGGVKGKKLELVVRDDENDLEKVREVDRYFIDEGIFIMIGHDLSSKAAPILETIEGEEIIVLSPTISTMTATGIRDNFYRTIASSANQGSKLAEYSEGRFDKTLIVYDSKNQSFADGIIDAFEEGYTGQTSSISIMVSVRDEMEAIVSALEKDTYDSVLMITNQSDAIDLYRFIKTKGYDYGCMSSNWGLVGSEISEIGEVIEGLAFITLESDEESKVYIAFENAYVEKFGEQPTIASAYAYETVLYLETVMEEAESIDYSGLTESIRIPRTIQGIMAEITMDDYGDSQRGFGISVVTDGELVHVDW